MTDLKLLALDSEDLDVISATTQDAVVRVGDMGFAKGDRRFALLMNRFAWEHQVAEKWGTWGEKSMYGKRYMGVIRSAYVVDARGKLAAIFAPVSPKAHAKKALQAVRALV